MTAQELKNSILQLAVEGKLVPHTNENASELLKNIKIEKAKLIAEGKINGSSSRANNLSSRAKSRDLPPIAEDEKPFDIPENWCWCRLGEISTYANTKEKISAENIIPEMWTLDLEDIEKNTGRIIQKIFVKDRKIAGDKICFEEGDILYSKLRPYLKKNLIAPANGICSSEIVPFKLYGQIYPEYILKVLICPHIDFIINSVTYGVKMPRVGTETMINLPIPLPPLSEQKAIVAKIEELLPYIEKYDAAYTKLEEFNKKFPADMQKSILQKAVQGKLIIDNGELKIEETGAQLLERIRAEKAKLIAEGKINGSPSRAKSRDFPPITEDEIPFDIPENWCWCRLGEISTYANTKEKISANFITPEMWTLDLEDIEKNTGRIIQKVLAKDRKIAGDKVRFEKGDILYSKLRPYLKKNLIAPSDGICSSEIVPFKLYGQINSEYILKVLICPYVDFAINSVTYGVKMPRVGTDTMINLPIPLPPLAEQKRIVAKIEELLPLCKKLER